MRDKTKNEAHAEAQKTRKRWTLISSLTSWIPGSRFVVRPDKRMQKRMANAYQFDHKKLTTLEKRSLTSKAARGLASTAIDKAIDNSPGVLPIVGNVAQSGYRGKKTYDLGGITIEELHKKSKLKASRRRFFGLLRSSSKVKSKKSKSKGVLGGRIKGLNSKSGKGRGKKIAKILLRR